jgi:hypothetical protein
MDLNADRFALPKVYAVESLAKDFSRSLPVFKWVAVSAENGVLGCRYTVMMLTVSFVFEMPIFASNQQMKRDRFGFPATFLEMLFFQWRSARVCRL